MDVSLMILMLMLSASPWLCCASLDVVWMAPFFSGGGYSSEAISFATALSNDARFKLQIVQHGDSFSADFVGALSDKLRRDLLRLERTRLDDRDEAIVICHSEPGAWNVAGGARYITSDCPPDQAALATIGRTMFETDRLPDGWNERLNRMDEVWVPTSFHMDIFSRGGVKPKKLVLMPEPVDVHFFNPELVKQLTLPEPVRDDDFVFLSIFKWEERKGWNILLEAVLREFASDEKACLVILTNAYHGSSNFEEQIDEFTRDLGIGSREQRARILVLPPALASTEMPALYKAANAFVLPSRGEGWGRPHVEAMSMGLPVIATNWSGPVEYMSEANSYPLNIEGLDVIQKGAFAGHKWARPSLSQLRRLMRHVFENRQEAIQRGKQARADMLSKYCPECVSKLVADQLVRLEKRARRRRDRRKQRMRKDEL